MNDTYPELADYVHVFQRYGENLSAIYLQEDDERYAFLFAQVVRMLIKPSAFNLSLPEPFRISAHRYCHGDAVTVKHLSAAANRNFMLCDLHDFIMLKGGLALKRREAAVRNDP
ncbi:MAG: hypothetical protein AB1717_00230 [Pseudomonadota bacterium]